MKLVSWTLEKQKLFLNVWLFWIGIFNVTVLITNGYGRSATNSAFYQLSATGQLYTFQTYAGNKVSHHHHWHSRITSIFVSLVVESISPANGSLEGGTILTIAGQYFSESGRYPLSINVGNEPCIILNMNLTIIQCQTSNMSAVNRSHFHGKLYVFNWFKMNIYRFGYRWSWFSCIFGK